MTQSKDLDTQTKFQQTADALVKYLLRHANYRQEDGISIGLWAEQAAKMMNENLLVNMYQHVAIKLINGEITAKYGSYLAHEKDNPIPKVWVEMDRLLDDLDGKLNAERID